MSRGTDAAVVAEDTGWSDGIPATATDTALPDSNLPDRFVRDPDSSLPPDTRPDLRSPDLAIPVDLQPDRRAIDSRSTDARPNLPNSLLGRTFTISANTPAPTPSSTCTRNTLADSFFLAFGDDIGTVTITWTNVSPPETYHGTLGPEASRITYHLNDAFAGGTMTLEWDQGVAVAQVSIDGSGVPIIVCVRAPLSPQP